MERIAGILFDIDNSVMPQGGPINPRVAELLLKVHGVVPIGPATGKNADYARGLGVGIGVHWHFVVAESGAQFLELTDPGSPPAWRHHPAPDVGSQHLSLFAQLTQLDPLRRTFLLRDQRVSFRPELKEGVLSLFPPDANVDQTLDWLAFFRDVVEAYALALQLNRFSDGCIDVVPHGISKRLGVMKVCRLLRCEPANLLTVVDGANDHELATGTTAIAVANANPKIKEIVRAQGGFLADFEDGIGFAQGLHSYSLAGLLPPQITKWVEDLFPHVAQRNLRAH